MFEQHGLLSCRRTNFKRKDCKGRFQFYRSKFGEPILGWIGQAQGSGETTRDMVV
jgi:hypothetical protein